MNRSVQGREPGDGVEAFKVKGMVYVKIEGQEGAECMRARTGPAWAEQGKLTDEARRNQQPL